MEGKLSKAFLIALSKEVHPYTERMNNVTYTLCYLNEKWIKTAEAFGSSWPPVSVVFTVFFVDPCAWQLLSFSTDHFWVNLAPEINIYSIKNPTDLYSI